MSDAIKTLSRIVPLRRERKRLQGICPLCVHPEETFFVDPLQETFTCTACGETGAIDRLLDTAPSTESPEVVDKILQLLARAEAVYRERLEGPEGSRARSYLHERGIDDETIRRWGIGYAPPSGIIKKKTKADMLIRSGLVVGESVLVERFLDRIVIPIRLNGITVSFAGRTLLNDGEYPKWVNGPNTSVFRNGAVLFGWDEARETIEATGTAIVVEGYFDVIALHATGFYNAIASSGVSLSDEAIDQLSHFTRRVYIAYDADEAGQSGALKVARRLEDAGIEALIAPLPADPDEIVRDSGRETFQDILDRAADRKTTIARTEKSPVLARAIELGWL